MTIGEAGRLRFLIAKYCACAIGASDYWASEAEKARDSLNSREAWTEAIAIIDRNTERLHSGTVDGTGEV